MIPIRRTARKETTKPRKSDAIELQDRRDPAMELPGSRADAKQATAKRPEILSGREPATVTSRGGNLLSLYFTRSFKRRQRPGSEARKAAYKKGDLSTRRDPDFCLPGGAPNKTARPAGFSDALRSFRED